MIAGAFAFPVNRALLKRGKGHTAVHNTGIHGGPPVKAVGVIAAVAAVFGTVVLIADAISDEGDGHGGGDVATQSEPATGEHGRATEHGQR